MKCIYTNKAETDLETIADYIALDNPQRALSFIDEIRQRCTLICAAPESGTLSPEFGNEIRKIPYKNYLIFYTHQEDNIIMLHILHGATNRIGSKESAK